MSAGPEGGSAAAQAAIDAIHGGNPNQGAPPPLLTQDPNAPSAATGAGRFLQGPLSPQSFQQGLVPPAAGDAFRNAGDRIGPGLNQGLSQILQQQHYDPRAERQGLLGRRAY